MYRIKLTVSFAMKFALLPNLKSTILNKLNWLHGKLKDLHAKACHCIYTVKFKVGNWNYRSRSNLEF